jgi:hypothetical protein
MSSTSRKHYIYIWEEFNLHLSQIYDFSKNSTTRLQYETSIKQINLSFIGQIIVMKFRIINRFQTKKNKNLISLIKPE